MKLITLRQIKLLGLLWLLAFSKGTFAQCDVSAFTVTKQDGTCFANGTITVQVPSAVTCTNWSAILTPPTGPEQSLSIPANGGPVVFTSLAAGSYSVRLFNGPSTVFSTNLPNPIVINTSYVNMNITSTSTQTTCNPASTSYTPNATLTVNIAAGTGVGPFVYTLPGAANSPSAPTMARTYTFTGLGDATHNFSVTDQVNGQVGCEVTQGQSRVIAANATARLPATTTGVAYKMGCPTTCNTYQVDFSFGNSVFVNRINANPDPNKAMISVNGAPAVPLTYVSLSVLFRSAILQSGDTWTATFTDGCDVTTASGTVPVASNTFTMTQGPTSSVSCGNQYSINTNGLVDNWCFGTQIIAELETSPGVFTPITGSPFTYVGVSNGNTQNNFLVPSVGNYRVTFNDGCHTATRFQNVVAPTTNPMDNIRLSTFNTLRENTGGVRIHSDGTFQLFAGLSYPLTVNIMPTDGSPSKTYTANHPYNLAGTFTVGFPITRNIPNNSYINTIIRDLPGNTSYTFTITDNCGYTITQSITTLSATYNPLVTVGIGCANSNTISYAMNSPSTTFVSGSFEGGRVRLFTDNGSGLPGTFVVDGVNAPAGNTNTWKTQTFNNVASGNYVIVIDLITQRSFNVNGYGATTGLNSGVDEPIYIPVNVPVYQDITVSNQSVLCNFADPNSGVVIAKITGGTPVYPLTWQIFATSNPSTPLQTFTANTPAAANALQQSFIGLAAGEYFVRTSYACYSTDSNISVAAAQQTPQAVSSSTKVCTNANTVTLGVPVSDDLYNITWTDNLNNTLGTGSSIAQTVTQTTTYTATVTLKPAVGCLNPAIYISDVTVSLSPDIVQIGTPTTTCGTGNYTVSATFSGTAPFTTTGTGAPGTWVDNGNGSHTWTSASIPKGTNYVVDIQDANTCNTLNIAGQEPVCAVLPVDLVTFSGRRVGSKIELYWKTANEKNFSHFELQRSENAKEFGSIGIIHGTKYSVYNYADTNPKVGLNYYRLKMVDLDGSYKLSSIRNITFDPNEPYVWIENPAVNGTFLMKTNLKAPTFKLLNVLGQQIAVHVVATDPETFIFQTRGVPSGIYYISTISEGKVITKKLLIN